MKKALFIVISLLFLLPCLLTGKEKQKVAVVEFNQVNCTVPDLGGFAANKVNDVVVGLGSVTTIDRANLAQIMREQNIGLTGIIDVKDNYKPGMISGIDFLITGTVSQGNVTKSRATRVSTVQNQNKTITTNRKEVWAYTGNANLQIRVINVNSGLITFSGTRQGSASADQPLLNQAGKEARPKNFESGVASPRDASKEKPELLTGAIESAAAGFSPDLFNLFKPEGYVIEVAPFKNKFSVTIDIGNDYGVRKGDTYTVIERGSPIKHPVTGAVVPGKEVETGKIKISDVGAGNATAYVSKKDAAKLKPGMLVKFLNHGKSSCCFF
jgi:hypothetical protein